MECGVTLHEARECGVMPCGRWISLIGAITHFFLSSLHPLPSSRNNLFPEFPNRRSTLSFPPPFSPAACRPCRVLCCPLRTVPVFSSSARCVLSQPCPQPPTARYLCPVLGCPLRATLLLSCHCTLPARRHPCPAAACYPLTAISVLLLESQPALPLQMV